MFNLKPFPLHFLCGLVICHLTHQRSHLWTEMFLQLTERGLRILQCIV